LAPRGLHREAAAAYIGIGVTLFDEGVNKGWLPRPTRMPGHKRKVWDRRTLDTAFDALGGKVKEETNEWDSADI
jgi:hypothetical protein